MSELTKIRDCYFQLKQHRTLAYIQDAKNYALNNFEYVLSVAYEHETRQTKPERHTIADNYGAGDLSRMEPCMFCEDYEKIESERDAMYDALKAAVAHIDFVENKEPMCKEELRGMIKALAKAEGE
jgi:hypothetical protein